MKDDATKQSTPTNERRRDEKQSTDKATKRNLASRPGETTRRQFTGRRNERNILSTIYLHIFLNSAWDNKERVIRPRTNNRQTQKNDDDDDKNKKQTEPILRQFLAARVNFHSLLTPIESPAGDSEIGPQRIGLNRDPSSKSAAVRDKGLN